MNFIDYCTKNNLKEIISHRKGETKWGEKVQLISPIEELENSTATYVIVGIPEDIGVLANQGVAGTKNAWKAFLKSMLNLQANDYTQPDNFVLLGSINCTHLLEQASTYSTTTEEGIANLGDLVVQLDRWVTQLISKIVSYGKIPIIIGGGHNNSYGIIKGTALALKHPINAVNLDAHSDFRPLEHRHSGNGFSYAFEEGFLKYYYVIGLQKQYNSQHVLDTIEKNKERISYTTFDQLFVSKTKSFSKTLQQAEAFVGAKNSFGVEVDLDSIENTPSSAQTPSGFSANQARRLVSHFGKNHNVAYLHLCEAAPKPDTQQEKLVGKLLSYLVIDFTNK